MTSTLEHLARAALSDATVTINPINYPDSVWNVGENASVSVKVNNTTGCILREVILELSSSSHIAIIKRWIFRRIWHLGEMEPGDEKTAFFYLSALSNGTAVLKAYLSAEVVPFATNYPVERSVYIYPD